MHTILPGLYAFTNLLVGRVYLIEDADGLTIIDAGTELAAPRILKQLAAMGRQASDVKRILITHGHPDHVGGLPELQAKTGAQVMAGAKDRATIEGREPIARVPRKTLSGLARLLQPPPTTLKGTPVARSIGEGDILPVLGGLHVLDTPGHSLGHVTFWQPEHRIAFCGDVVMRLPNLRPPFSFFTVDMAENQRSLKRVVALEPRVLCFGHGRPLTTDTANKLRAYAHKAGVL